MNDMRVDDWSDDVHGDAALYAVDALEPEERAAFEEHLRGCAACRSLSSHCHSCRPSFWR